MAELDEDERRDIAHEFKSVVNMPSAALRSWLKTDECQAGGMTDEGGKGTKSEEHEAVGHKMGRCTLSLQATKAADLSDDDFAAMCKVIGYVRRDIKQRPHRDVAYTLWGKSLMNWEHDPMK